ncbi:hypothetical protein AMTR_s00086p00112820 [Amborella trichopoda]|uniref:Uncharacterized protein n=1 Tax=Amborella trichopoda TaxID=13333 RepID=W1P4G0_AMBTC|nr:hypothetical protein AMTR_s00086p00112820 [Amborella trichopoda]
MLESSLKVGFVRIELETEIISAESTTAEVAATGVTSEGGATFEETMTMTIATSRGATSKPIPSDSSGASLRVVLGPLSPTPSVISPGAATPATCEGPPSFEHKAWSKLTLLREAGGADAVSSTDLTVEGQASWTGDTTTGAARTGRTITRVASSLEELTSRTRGIIVEAGAPAVAADAPPASNGAG